MVNPTEVLRSRNTLLDYNRLQEQFELMKKQKQVLLANSLPATIRIANEIESAKANGDFERANLLHQIHKSFDRGVIPYGELPKINVTDQVLPPVFGDVQTSDQPPLVGGHPQPTGPIAMPGYGEAVGSIEAAKKGLSEQAQKDVQLKMDPLIAYEEQLSKGRADRQVDREKKLPSQQRITNTVTRVSDKYKELEALGGVISPNNSTWENIKARVGSSPTGQRIGGYVGTEEQRIRDEIAALRPTLMNDIRQASEMGARGLDSEKELEFYLTAATDPTRSLEANLTALAILNDAYGLGALQYNNPSQDQLRALQDEFVRSNSRNTPSSGGWKFLGVE